MPVIKQDSAPLSGRTILLACSAKKLHKLRSGIEALGGSAIPLPVIEIRELPDKRQLDDALTCLDTYAWIVFTSAYAVQFFFQRMRQNGTQLPAERMPKICVVGPETAKEVEAFGSAVELIPERFVAEGIVEALARYHGDLRALAGRRVLIPRAKEGREVLLESLCNAGILVDLVPCYETVKAEPDHETVDHLSNLQPDMIVFTSPSAVRSLVEILGQERASSMLARSAVAVIGPITATACESFGKTPEVIPPENTVASMLDAIVAYYRARR